jgi:hypothetical protein
MRTFTIQLSGAKGSLEVGTNQGHLNSQGLLPTKATFLKARAMTFENTWV